MPEWFGCGSVIEYRRLKIFLLLLYGLSDLPLLKNSFYYIITIFNIYIYI